MAQFKDLLSELRKDAGLSQKQFAELFHQSGSTISSYETGRNEPNYETLIQYAEYFNVTTDYLIGRVKHNLSPEILSERIVDGVEIWEIVKQIRSLPADRRRAVCLMIDDMQFSSSIREKTKEAARGGEKDSFRNSSD